MENKVSLEGDKLVIKLDELEKKVLEKAFPLIAPMVKATIGMLVRIVLMLVSMDKDLVFDCFERVENGEAPVLVAKELLDKMNISSESLANLVPKMDMPSTEEIKTILDWGDKECAGSC